MVTNKCFFHQSQARGNLSVDTRVAYLVLIYARKNRNLSPVPATEGCSPTFRSRERQENATCHRIPAKKQTVQTGSDALEDRSTLDERYRSDASHQKT
jgi:hypothetical protein